MRNRLTVVLALVAVFGLAAVLRAEDAKEVKLTGTFTCAKCQLKETDKCQNALVVKDGDKTEKYYLVENDLSKKSHNAICGEAKEKVTMTGTVSEKEGQKWLTVTKIEGLEEKKG